MSALNVLEAAAGEADDQDGAASSSDNDDLPGAMHQDSADASDGSDVDENRYGDEPGDGNVANGTEDEDDASSQDSEGKLMPLSS